MGAFLFVTECDKSAYLNFATGVKAIEGGQTD